MNLYHAQGSNRFKTSVARPLHQVVKVHLAQEENAGAVQEAVGLQVTDLLQSCYKSVTERLQKCYRTVAVLYQNCYQTAL